MADVTCKSKPALELQLGDCETGRRLGRPESCDTLRHSAEFQDFSYILKKIPTTFCIKNKAHQRVCVISMWLCVCVTSYRILSHEFTWPYVVAGAHKSQGATRLGYGLKWCHHRNCPCPCPRPCLQLPTAQMVATLASVDNSPVFLHMQKCEQI